MLGILTALLSGALMSVQGVFNTEASKNAGLWTATCFVQFSALCVVSCSGFSRAGQDSGNYSPCPISGRFLEACWALLSR